MGVEIQKLLLGAMQQPKAPSALEQMLGLPPMMGPNVITPQRVNPALEQIVNQVPPPRLILPNPQRKQ